LRERGRVTKRQRDIETKGNGKWVMGKGKKVLMHSINIKVPLFLCLYVSLSLCH